MKQIENRLKNKNDDIIKKIDEEIIRNYFNENEDLYEDELLNSVKKTVHEMYNTYYEEYKKKCKGVKINTVTIDITQSIKKKNIEENKNVYELDVCLSLLLRENKIDKTIVYEGWEEYETAFKDVSSYIIVANKGVTEDLKKLFKKSKINQTIFFTPEYKSPVTNIVQQFMQLK